MIERFVKYSSYGFATLILEAIILIMIEDVIYQYDLRWSGPIPFKQPIFWCSYPIIALFTIFVFYCLYERRVKNIG
jgi:hypothetical protein